MHMIAFTQILIILYMYEHCVTLAMTHEQEPFNGRGFKSAL